MVADDMNIAIIGASGTIGSAFVRLLAEREHTATIYAYSRHPVDFKQMNVIRHSIDIEQEQSIQTAAAVLPDDQTFDIVIIASGILHYESLQPEKSLSDLSSQKFTKVFAINTIGPALIAKYFLPRLNRKQRSVFAALTARVGSISDNQLGGWYAYRASKSALNMILKNASIEMARRNRMAIIVGLHPGTVESELSKPFQKNVKPERLFTGEYSATKLLSVIEKLRIEDSGKIFAWDGQEILP